MKTQSHEEGVAANDAAAAAGLLGNPEQYSPGAPGQAPPEQPLEGGVLRIAGPSS